MSSPQGDSERTDEAPTQEVSQASRSLSPQELAYLAGTDAEDEEEQAEAELRPN